MPLAAQIPPVTPPADLWQRIEADILPSTTPLSSRSEGACGSGKEPLGSAGSRCLARRIHRASPAKATKRRRAVAGVRWHPGADRGYEVSFRCATPIARNRSVGSSQTALHGPTRFSANPNTQLESFLDQPPSSSWPRKVFSWNCPRIHCMPKFICTPP